jgi:hypothetical protein
LETPARTLIDSKPEGRKAEKGEKDAEKAEKGTRIKSAAEARRARWQPAVPEQPGL